MSDRIWIGTIEPQSDAGIDSSKWLALIESHPALAHVPPRRGIDPFSRQPREYRAPETTAIVRDSELDIGSISAALDGSPILNVYARQDSIALVVGIAEQIAAALDGTFVRSK